MYEMAQVKKLLLNLPMYVQGKAIVIMGVTYGQEANPPVVKYIEEFEKQLAELAEGIDT